MDNAVVIDVILGVILLAGILIGAKRGLFKSLVGLVIVVVALVGAVVLADLAVEPVTDLLAPVVEDAVVSRFAARLDKAAGADDAEAYDDVSDMMEQYGVFGEARRKILEAFRSAAGDPLSTARTEAVNAFRSALSASLRTVLRITVHTVLVLILYAVLLLALKLIALACDHLLDAPLLSTVNGVLGAVLGFAEAVVLLCVLLQIASRLGVTFFAEHAEGTYLLSFFLSQTPARMIAALFHNL